MQPYEKNIAMQTSFLMPDFFKAKIRVRKKHPGVVDVKAFVRVGVSFVSFREGVFTLLKLFDISCKATEVFRAFEGLTCIM